MGQSARTTKHLLDFSGRASRGAHPGKVIERVEVISKKTGEVHEELISADQLLTLAEFQTRETSAMWQERWCAGRLESGRNCFCLFLPIKDSNG